MKKLKRGIEIILFAGIIVLMGCGGHEQAKKAPVKVNQQSIEQKREKSKKKQSKEDIKLDKALARYRKARKEKKINRTTVSIMPNEKKFGLDLSNLKYINAFDIKEKMEAFQAGKEYIEGLGVKAKKYEVCVDPRILNIYQDKDKGVAKGYRNKNIFVLEYMDNNGKWKYIIVVRKGKGKPWKGIYHGTSYKK